MRTTGALPPSSLPFMKSPARKESTVKAILTTGSVRLVAILALAVPFAAGLGTVKW
jgi:hypothetical protein